MSSQSINKYEVPLWRTLVIYGLIVVVIVSLVYRLFSLQVVQAQTWLGQAVDNYTTEISDPASRGIIYDRNGYILARRHGVSGKRYILGGENISFNRFFATLAAVSCTRRWLIHLPQTLALAFAKVEQFLAKTFGIWPLITPEWTKTFLHNWAQTSSSAEHDLGYTITPFTDAIQQTVRWIRTSSTSQTSNAKRGLVEPRLQIEERRR